MSSLKAARRLRIKERTRLKIFGTASSPRMSVFRSNGQIYVQFIDDEKGVTLVSASSRNKEVVERGHLSGIAQAVAVGALAAKVALAKGIKTVVFDRNGYLYHGRVKALAESARESGLDF